MPQYITEKTEIIQRHKETEVGTGGEKHLNDQAACEKTSDKYGSGKKRESQNHRRIVGNPEIGNKFHTVPF